MPWYAFVLMLAGPVALAVARVGLTVARLAGWKRDPRPGYIDLTGRRL